MTEEECDRVEEILRRMDEEDDDEIESLVAGGYKVQSGSDEHGMRPRTDTTTSTTDGGESYMSRPMSTTSSAFFPEDHERLRLVDIDRYFVVFGQCHRFIRQNTTTGFFLIHSQMHRQLQLIIPEPEWDAKSI